MEPLRIGLLGAARIAPRALLEPARAVPEMMVTAVAARDPDRARAFAQRHGIMGVHDSYAALLDDPALDAVYIALPNSLHARWTLAALAAGKHVLCEKPLAANADEAGRMRAAAERYDRVLMEAFHYRYHPLAARLRTLVASGILGHIRHVSADFCVPMLRPGDIRWRYELAGGAMMDLGCYTVDLLRFVTGAEPTVTYARATLASPQVDRRMTAFLRFPDGTTGRLTVSMWSSSLFKIEARVRGERGEVVAINPILPHLFHRLMLRAGPAQASEQFGRTPTYVYQLRAFVNAVQHGMPLATDAANGVATMTVIDSIYQQAGLHRRGEDELGRTATPEDVTQLH